jgi:hypothetical protein
MQHKAQTEVFFLVIFAAFAAICLFFAAAFLDYFNIYLPAPITSNTTNPAGAAALTVGTTSISLLSTLLVFVFIAGAIGGAISGAFSGSNPAFFFIGIFIILFELLTAVLMHNVFFSIVQSSAFNGTILNISMATFMQYLPLFALIAAILISLLTYGHGGGGERSS